ncbi:MAG TPA: serine/threonine-protein kinase [Planctomycetota bacterium]|nr:serine/threonine-protein kinase [Planctomycetota bacterium]
MPRKGPKTFEQLAVENGLVTETQVRECLAAQEESRKDERDPEPVERLMIAKGFMSEEEVRAVKTALGRMSRDEEKSGDPLRIGNYEIIGKIGDGGLGTVYKARQISMSRDVALKVLHKKWLTDEEFKKRFLLEARLAGRLSHQNLIQVYDVGRDRGIYYFSMEFVDGETIEDMIERDGPLENAKAIDFVMQVLRSIAYIKNFDIVHRDIKPGNMMVTRKGVVKLGDFGFVKSKLDPMIATEGEVLGTPDYISPEQAMGLENIDWRSDQYSLGCSLYHMVTGKPPYEGSGSSVMRQHIKADLPDPRTINPKIPDAVVQILERMMAKDPNDRYQDTDVMFEDLELVKMGHDPTIQRLDAGKSTIIRAFKIEQVRAQRAKSEVELLREEVERMRKYMWAAFLAAGLMFVLFTLILFFKFTGQ